MERHKTNLWDAPRRCKGWGSLFPEPCSSSLLSCVAELAFPLFSTLLQNDVNGCKIIWPLFFKGSCSPGLLAKITVSVRDAGKQSGLWQPICASVGANSNCQMDASAILGVRCNDTVGCQFSR